MTRSKASGQNRGAAKAPRGGKHRGPAGKPRRGKGGGGDDPEALMADLLRRMEACPDAETLNDRVIIPFALALEKTCAARDYVLNIYGERSNVVVSTEDDAETLYYLIDEYLETAAGGIDEEE